MSAIMSGTILIDGGTALSGKFSNQTDVERFKQWFCNKFIAAVEGEKRYREPYGKGKFKPVKLFSFTKSFFGAKTTSYWVWEWTRKKKSVKQWEFKKKYWMRLLTLFEMVILSIFTFFFNLIFVFLHKRIYWFHCLCS